MMQSEHQHEHRNTMTDILDGLLDEYHKSRYLGDDMAEIILEDYDTKLRRIRKLNLFTNLFQTRLNAAISLEIQDLEFSSIINREYDETLYEELIDMGLSHETAFILSRQ